MAMSNLAVSSGDFTQQGEDPRRGLVESERGVLGLIELILKKPDRLDRLIGVESTQVELMPKLLTIALAGFTLFGIAQALVLASAGVWPRFHSLTEVFRGNDASPLALVPAATSPLGHWLDGSALALMAAYTCGLIAASGICLPSLYFYGLLAGVRLRMRDVVLHTLKSKAAAAVALIGILPIYAALAMGVVILPMPPAARTPVLWFGLVLPFIAGLWGTWSLWRGFQQLGETLPEGCRGRRACFLRRLVFAWAACYTAVTPALIFTIWQRLS
jgi:hypothetical protein